MAALPLTPTTPTTGVLPDGASSFRVVASAGWGLDSMATIIDETTTNENSPSRKTPLQLRTGTELEVEVPHGTVRIAIGFDEDNVYPVTVSTVTGGDAWPLQETGISAITAKLDATNGLTLFFNSPTLNPSPEVDINLYLFFL